MRVQEMQQREDFLPILSRTLERGFSMWLGASVEVHAEPAPGRQTWLLQPFLSACYVPGADRRVRRFLRDSIAFTAVTRRAPLQYAGGVALTTAAGLRLAGRPCFALTPSLEGAAHTLVVPGNLRVRLFDFAARRSLVLLKDGFSSQSMRREVETRAEAGASSLPILRHADDWTWFEEPLFDGYALARCPPWLPRAALEERAFEILRAWTSARLRVQGVSSWAAEKLESVEALCQRLPRSRSGSGDRIVRFATALARQTSPLEEITVGRTHGDFQAGNVLVSRDGGRVVVIDWEHAGERMCDYDPLVYELGARRGPSIIVEQVRRFLGGEPWRRLGHEALWDVRRRRALLAAFLLEDLLWFTQADLGGPFTQESAGLRMRLARSDALLGALSDRGAS